MAGYNPTQKEGCWFTAGWVSCEAGHNPTQLVRITILDLEHCTLLYTLTMSMILHTSSALY